MFMRQIVANADAISKFQFPKDHATNVMRQMFQK